MTSPSKNQQIDSFQFQAGRILARKYEVVSRLGGGWEGEVYRVRERGTGIERTAKFFFPQRNPKNRIAKLYATKLHKLRQCEILIKYHTQDTITFRGIPITFLVSEYVKGEILTEFIARQRGKRLGVFEALHLLHALAVGMEPIHKMREYHGDLHAENIIVQRVGLGFNLKLIDLYYWNAPKYENIQDDVCNLIRIFYDAIGGQRHYRKQEPVIKNLVCGLKRSLIWSRYRTAAQLRRYLETLQWE